MKENGIALFRQRLVKQVLWIIIIMAIASVIGNIIIAYPMEANLKWVLAAVLSGVVLKFGISSRYYNQIAFILATLIVYVIFPLGCINSGIYSNNSVGYTFVMVVGFTVLFDHWKRWFLVGSVVVLYAAFQILEYSIPEIMPMHSNKLLLMDKLIQIPMLLGTTLMILSSYRKVFNEKHHQLEEVSKEYHELAYTDMLTGLANRGCVFEKLESLIEDKETFITLMIDLDNFKHVNDTYGHLEGDKILVSLAKQLVESCPDCISARYGGDEFIMVITEDLVHAPQYINAFFDDIRENENFRQYGVTISGGFSWYRGQGSLNEFMKHIDSILYQAKNSGKDQILEKEFEIKKEK